MLDIPAIIWKTSFLSNKQSASPGEVLEVAPAKVCCVNNPLTSPPTENTIPEDVKKIDLIGCRKTLLCDVLNIMLILRICQLTVVLLWYHDSCPHQKQRPKTTPWQTCFFSILTKTDKNKSRFVFEKCLNNMIVCFLKWLVLGQLGAIEGRKKNVKKKK